MRALLHIAERGTMSAAAAAVGLSQPALTQGLAKLEASLGVSLFVRRSDGMVATPVTENALPRVQAAFEHVAAAMRAATRGVRRGFARPENLLTATQMRGLLALAQAGSFVGAAAASGQSQPAVHRAVRELEQLCGVALVERRGRGVAFTDAGRRLARGLRLANQELATALEELRPDETMAGRIVVGAMPLSRAKLIPRAIAKLTREAPSASFDVVEGSFLELVEPLRDGTLDLAVGALRDPCPPDLTQWPLLEDRLSVIARVDHPLVTSEVAALADLTAFPWIVGRKGSPLRLHWSRLFEAASLPRPSAPIECGSVMAIRELLLRSDCLTLLSRDQVALEIEAGVLAQLGHSLEITLRTIGVITRRDWRSTLLQQRFLDLLKEAATDAAVQETE